LLGLYLSALVLYPRVTVEVTSPEVPGSVLTSEFTIQNTGFITLEDLQAGLNLCRININSLPTNFGCDYANQPTMIWTPWRRSFLLRDERFTINLADAIHTSPSSVKYADIGILVEYKPWFMPFRMSRIYRFQTRYGSDDILRWYSMPLAEQPARFTQ
jgi:hypothetical protein